jgi:hypothetical protein
MEERRSTSHLMDSAGMQQTNRENQTVIARSGAKWMVIEAKPSSRAIQKLVDERDANDQCVKCGKQCDRTDEKQRRKLGLCPIHYGQFNYARGKLSNKEEIAQFEADLVEAGELMLEPAEAANDYLARVKKVKS